jgi:hypothetical protein
MRNGSRLLALLGLALDGLRRKAGRNVLTMLGVLIGVLALTLIVGLGQGMTNLIEATVSGGENLRRSASAPASGTASPTRSRRRSRAR